MRLNERSNVWATEETRRVFAGQEHPSAGHGRAQRGRFEFLDYIILADNGFREFRFEGCKGLAELVDRRDVICGELEFSSVARWLPQCLR